MKIKYELILISTFLAICISCSSEEVGEGFVANKIFNCTIPSQNTTSVVSLDEISWEGSFKSEKEFKEAMQKNAELQKKSSPPVDSEINLFKKHSVRSKKIILAEVLNFRDKLENFTIEQLFDNAYIDLDLKVKAVYKWEKDLSNNSSPDGSIVYLNLDSKPQLNQSLNIKVLKDALYYEKLTIGISQLRKDIESSHRKYREMNNDLREKYNGGEINKELFFSEKAKLNEISEKNEYVNIKLMPQLVSTHSKAETLCGFEYLKSGSTYLFFLNQNELGEYHVFAKPGIYQNVPNEILVNIFK